ncbi:TonB-dependent receptor domain-containing protein [Sphingopyxis sp. PET50]|uniref:TonB-dependent receptor domain-containing protein n=1 Tax=Sphingopyxis sp. PET50 TaxID=2976533 RepID=UPI00391A5DC3
MRPSSTVPTGSATGCASLPSGRLTHDKVFASLSVTAVPNFVGFGPLQPPFEGTVKADDFSWRFGGQFDVAQDVMLYASMSRGYKGPVAASLNNGAVNEVRPEIVYAKEVGIKTMLFDRKLTLNLAAFHSKFKDFQATIIDDSLDPPHGPASPTRGRSPRRVSRSRRGCWSPRGSSCR